MKIYSVGYDDGYEAWTISYWTTRELAEAARTEQLEDKYDDWYRNQYGHRWVIKEIEVNA